MATDYMADGRFACADCGHDVREMGEMFMLDHDLWERVAMSRVGYTHMLCVGCTEGRLGRELVSGDFLPCPLNERAGSHSLRLRQRLWSGGA